MASGSRKALSSTSLRAARRPWRLQSASMTRSAPRWSSRASSTMNCPSPELAAPPPSSWKCTTKQRCALSMKNFHCPPLTADRPRDCARMLELAVRSKRPENARSTWPAGSNSRSDRAGRATRLQATDFPCFPRRLHRRQDNRYLYNPVTRGRFDISDYEDDEYMLASEMEAAVRRLGITLP